MLQKILVLLILTFSLTQLKAQNTLQGKITATNATTGLQGVTVLLKSTKYGAITNSKGQYIISAIPDGQYSMQVNHEGYAIIDTLILLKGASLITLDIVLKEKVNDLEDVIVVASSRNNSRIEDLPTKVEVLGAEEVHEENQIKPGNIASLLGDIAGIQIQQTSAATGNADMRIQGLQGKYTQLLRDGMPLFGGYSGSFSILQIPPLDLQQIELIKGASSTLYGGGAIAGMVNLISKKPKLGKRESMITLNRSTLKENNFNVFTAARKQKFGYTLYDGTTYQQAVDVNGDGFSDVPEVKSIFVHPRLFIYPNDKSTLIIGYTLNSEDRTGGSMQGIANKTGSTNFFIRNRSFRNTADVQWDYSLNTSTHISFKASTSFFNRKMQANTTYLTGRQQIWYSELALSKRTEKHILVAGINFNGDQFRKQDAPISSILPNEQNRTFGLFVQSDWKLHPQLTWQNGLRVDMHSIYGRFFLPRTAIMYKPAKAWTIRASAGMGYKTPTLFTTELDERQFNQIAGFTNNIRAERSRGLNMDINYQKHIGEWKLTVNQTFFYNQIKHPILIEALPSLLPPSPYQYRNASAPVSTKGLETYIQATHDELEIYLGYVFTDAIRKYNPTNAQLPLIAKNKFAGILAYEFSENFRAGIEAAYTGKQFLDNGSSTPGYFFGAAMIRYGIGKVSFVLNCENLLDYRQNKQQQVVFPPINNPSFPEIWAPLDGRAMNISMLWKW